MSNATENFLRAVMHLPAIDRAAIVEELIASLDKSDPELDVLWQKEAESRLAAYRSGELDAVDADQVFVGLGKQI
ncbi:MAG: addiction module protein [Methylococcales bacterium]